MSSSTQSRMPSDSMAFTDGQVSHFPSAIAQTLFGTAYASGNSVKKKVIPSGGGDRVTTTAGYKLWEASELVETPSVAWLVKGLMPQKGLGLFYGPSGVGKSFLLLDLVCSIAEGERWFGQRTKRAPVIYLCLEGSAGFVGRVKAWQNANGRSFPELIRIIVQPFNLHKSDNVYELLRGVKRFIKSLPRELGPPVIVVDTLNRAMPGTDENGSTDMGISLEACNLLVEGTGGFVLVVHHSGKDADRGPRGHSSLVPAADASIVVTRSGQKRYWEAKKVKDGEDGIEGSFQLEQVVLGIDSDGDEVTSCVVCRDTDPGGVKGESELSSSLKRALSSLEQAIHKSGAVGEGGTAFVDLQAWRASFFESCTVSSESGRRNAFHRAKNDLQERGFVVLNGDSLEVKPACLTLMKSPPG